MAGSVREVIGGEMIQGRDIWKNRIDEFIWRHAPCWLWNILSIKPARSELWNGSRWIDEKSPEGLKLCPPWNIKLEPGEILSFIITFEG